MKKLLIGLVFWLIAAPAWAQNPQCPTRPAGDNTNACASTAFVTTAAPAWPNNTTTYFRGDGTYVTLNFAAVAGQATLAQFPTIAANTVLSNWTSSGAVPMANVWPACASDGSHALTYTNGTGVLCTVISAGAGTVTSVTCNGGLTGGAITTTGTCAVDIASAANFYAGTANKIVDAATIYTAVPTPAFSATPTFDFNTASSFAPGVLTANITSMTCNNLKPNQAGFIKLTQDGTGGRTSVFCSAFKFQGGSPTLSTGASNVDWINYICQSSTICVASIVKNPT